MRVRQGSHPRRSPRVTLAQSSSWLEQWLNAEVFGDTTIPKMHSSRCGLKRFCPSLGPLNVAGPLVIDGIKRQEADEDWVAGGGRHRVRNRNLGIENVT